MRYRRARVAGGTYFFTVNLAERNRSLLVDHVDLLRSAMGRVKAAHPFHIDAVVILPDHLHTIWTLPEGDRDYPVRWALIKAGLSRRISSGEQRNESRFSKGERGRSSMATSIGRRIGPIRASIGLLPTECSIAIGVRSLARTMRALSARGDAWLLWLRLWSQRFYEALDLMQNFFKVG
jgi:REP element-mobilizing transposase RayT